MWSGINGSRELKDGPMCPSCGKPVTVHYTEREYETDNPEHEDDDDADPLASCAAIEAWIECPRCSDIYMGRDYNKNLWSDEIFGSDPITNEHIEQAVNGAIAYWGKSRITEGLNRGGQE